MGDPRPDEALFPDQSSRPGRPDTGSRICRRDGCNYHAAAREPARQFAKHHFLHTGMIDGDRWRRRSQIELRSGVCVDSGLVEDRRRKWPVRFNCREDCARTTAH